MWETLLLYNVGTKVKRLCVPVQIMENSRKHDCTQWNAQRRITEVFSLFIYSTVRI